MITTENPDKIRGTKISDKYDENFEVYTEDAGYAEPNGDDIVDLYFHVICIELMYYSNNTYKKNTMGTDALGGRVLRLTVSYDEATNILWDLGYELYSHNSLDIYSDCLYSKKDEIFCHKCIYLGIFTREIWTKKESIKPFRFERCEISEQTEK